MYSILFSYGMAFLTIDDVSQAVSGQTRITVNKYCEVIKPFTGRVRQVPVQPDWLINRALNSIIIY